MGIRCRIVHAGGGRTPRTRRTLRRIDLRNAAPSSSSWGVPGTPRSPVPARVAQISSHERGSTPRTPASRSVVVGAGASRLPAGRQAGPTTGTRSQSSTGSGRQLHGRRQCGAPGSGTRAHRPARRPPHAARLCAPSQDLDNRDRPDPAAPPAGSSGAARTSRRCAPALHHGRHQQAGSVDATDINSLFPSLRPNSLDAMWPPTAPALLAAEAPQRPGRRPHVAASDSSSPRR